MVRRRVALSIALGAAVACGPPPPEVPQRRFSIEAIRAQNPPLPLDPKVTHGVLPNGLAYYILPNRRPESRAQLWLAVNAGSVLEDKDQRGLAHFVEHMAFNGTRRFPKTAILDFLERSGVRFGADLNAYTSFDETVYQLQIPTDRPGLLGKGLQVLRDFADGVAFEPLEVEKERGVVLEEWRLRMGASTRLDDKLEASTSNASPYLTHRPIGKAEIIQSAPVSAITRFYKDWYRPNLMAVIAVGDFSAAEVESRLKLEFTTLTNPRVERPRPPMQLAFSDTTTVSIDADPELPQTRISIDNQGPHHSLETTKDYRRGLVADLWNGMLNARLDEIARRPDAPFLRAGSSRNHSFRPVDGFRQVATVRDESVIDGLAALYREVLRVERHGFTATELERAKAQLLRASARRVAQADRRDSGRLVARLTRHFLSREAMLGPAAEDKLMKELLPPLALPEVNALGATLSRGRHISILGPSSMAKPSEDTVRATVRDVVTGRITPYDDGGPPRPLMAQLPAPGSVVTTTQVAELAATEWKLSNGVRVVVRPTVGGDTVHLRAFSSGGTSAILDTDWDSARVTADVALRGGLGALDGSAVRRALAGKIVHLDLQLSELEEGFTGDAAEEDLETLLQLVHLAATAPRRDEAAFASWRSGQLAALKNRQANPDAAFADELAVWSSQNHLRRRPPTAESLQKVSLDKIFAIHKDRFGDASDFTFVFVGNVDLTRLKGLVETYLASLPAQGRKESWRDINVVVPSGAQTKTFFQGLDPKAKVSLRFHGPETWSLAAAYDLAILVEVLRMRLRELLREDMSGTYGVRVTGAIARRPKEEYGIEIAFGCAPDNVDRLVRATFEEVLRLQAKGIDEDHLRRIRELRRRGRETALKDDVYWLHHIEGVYTYADDPKTADAEPAAPPSPDRVRAAAKKYLSSNQYLLGILKPRPSSK